MVSAIVCCDWGTSAFRIKVLHVSSRVILWEDSSHDGAASMFSRWQTENEKKPLSRLDYYLSFLNERIDQMITRTNINPAETAVLISGMAGSSIGMMELPYASVPFGLDGRNAVIKRIHTARVIKKTYLVSGVSNGKDVMRGEETQLIGINAIDPTLFAGDAVCILPGTHSKHVHIQGGAVQSFKTYVTGEMFRLVNEHSTMRPGDDHAVNTGELTKSDIAAFSEGVQKAQSDNLLHSLFTVRVNKVLRNSGDRENYLYLSGLLIGSELNSLAGTNAAITLCSTGNVFNLYKEALATLGLLGQTTLFSSRQMEDAYWEGQLKIFDHLITSELSNER